MKLGGKKKEKKKIIAKSHSALTVPGWSPTPMLGKPNGAMHTVGIVSDRSTITSCNDTCQNCRID